MALLVSSTIACGKKSAPPVTKEAPVASAPIATAAVPPVASESAAPPPVVDDAIEGEFAHASAFTLPEGKLLPLPKFKPADKDAVKAHVAALQSEFEAAVKEGFKEISRFNASFVPATYITMFHEGKRGARLTESEPNVTMMIVAEGASVSRETLARLRGPTGDEGSDEPYTLMQTSRGYFIDGGGGELVYILQRTGKPMYGESKGLSIQCKGRRWNPADGTVGDGAVPDYPGRGKDVDGDGINDFPDRRFTFELTGWGFHTNPNRGELCNWDLEQGATIDVLGVVASSGKSAEVTAFYERRRKAARARATRIRAWAGTDATPKTVTRRAGDLRMTNDCALDVAQTAAELYVYARTLGAGENAIDEADALMKGFALKPSACGGLGSHGTKPANPPDDHWPELRKALLAAKIEALATDSLPAPSASASVAPAVPSVSAAPSASK